MKVGPRFSNFMSSILFGSGCILGAIGIHYHSLAALYIGFGFFGGIGVGLSYTQPV